MIFKLRLLGPLVLVLFPLLFAQGAASQTGELRGLVLDPSGAAIPGATITLTATGPALQTPPLQTKSDANGRYRFPALAPGGYMVSAAAAGFATGTTAKIAVTAGQVKQLDLSLRIAVAQQNVTVPGQVRGVGVNPDQNPSAMVLSGSALNALSDDPDELRNELQALAGPAAGPSGGQIYIDGFAGGQLPPKSSILEVRVNQNPFSAEFDRLGYGRVEIITKPGSQKLEGSLAGSGNVSALNTAVPLVAEQPTYYQYALVGNLSGPLSKHASGFFSGYYVNRQNQAIVVTVNPQDTSASILQAVPQPIDYLSLNPRLDFQSGNHTFTVRDLFYRTRESGSGVGSLTLDLPSQASNVISEENALEVSDVVLVSPRFVNETHFQWSRIYNDQVPAGVSPTVTVEGAFTSGGSSEGIERDTQNNFELQNYSTVSAGTQTLRFGARLRLYDDQSTSTGGANGAYTFYSVSDYQAQSPDFYSGSIVNNAEARVLLFDGALFFQDDWRWKPNFDLSAGIRLEGQNRVHDHADWAPRLAIAWSPDRRPGTAQPKTVIRAGSGWFYTRFTVPNFFSSDSGTPYVINAIHHNGINEPEFAGPCSPLPCSYFPAASTAPQQVNPNLVPTVESIDPHFRAALDMQTGVGVDRQITRGILANITWLYTRGVHQYLQNNVNAPAFDVSTYTVTGQPAASNNYQFQSGGVYRQNQLIFTVNTQLKRLVMNANYMLNQAKSDTQDAYYFPSVPDDPGLDYGRAGFGNRQRLTLVGSYSGPWGLAFSPMIVAQSGTPYNLTIGTDATASNQFNARPTYGVCGAPYVHATRYGCLDTAPAGKSERIVPYGVGLGPANAAVHLRVSKVIGVGPRIGSAQSGQTFQTGNSVSGRGLSGGSGSVKLDESAPRRDNLTLVLSAANLFNMVNLGTPNGVLLSPLFNQSQTVAPPPFQSATPGNRAISFQASFSF
jgi:Carboxypeptidase regulatory-like domain